MTRQQIVAATLVGSLTSVIAALTLKSEPAGFGGPPFFCMLCDQRWLQDVLLNVLLFMPLGASLTGLGFSSKRSLAICFVYSALIEFLQATIVTGRDSSLRDIITNSVGGWLGAALAHSWRSWVLPRAARAGRFAILAGVLWLATIVMTLWALEPSVADRRRFGQYAPTDRILPEFKGRIFSACFNGGPLPVGAFADQRSVAEALRRRQAWLSATVGATPPTAGMATIVAVVDQQQDEDLTLSQSGADLLLKVRLRSNALGLNSPTLRLEGVLRRDASHSGIEVGGGLLGATISLDARRGLEIQRNELTITSSGGWMLLYPFSLTSRWISAALGLLWMTTLTLPLQYYWSLRVGDANSRTLALRSLPFLVTLVLLVGIPLLFGTPLVRFFEIVGTIAGVLVGNQLASFAQRWRTERERIAARRQLA